MRSIYIKGASTSLTHTFEVLSQARKKKKMERRSRRREHLKKK